MKYINITSIMLPYKIIRGDKEIICLHDSSPFYKIYFPIMKPPTVSKLDLQYL